MSVRVERRGPVLVVTLDRPEKRNAFDAALTASLSDAFDQFEDDPGLRVAILTAAGTVFSAGSDLLTGPGEPTARGGEYGLIRRRPVKPVIAAVQGPAIGGGFELVLACDLVVAARDVYFALPEAARGRVANAGGLFRTDGRLPRNLAAELLIGGGRLTAERAFHAGLVNRLTEAGQALPCALELARAIVDCAPDSVEQTLRAMHAMDAESERLGWNATLGAVSRMTGSADRAEGDAAFRERRQPRWAAQETGSFLAPERVCRVAGISTSPAAAGPIARHGGPMGSSRDLNLIADKLELTELVARIARAVDRKDRQGILDCYAEESFDDHGRFRGGRDEFAEFICNNPGFTTASPFIYHLMGQSLFDVDGDQAHGETYFAYWMQTTPDTLYQSLGRYLDYFERTEGRWLLSYRRVVMEWDGTQPATNAVPGGHFRGTRDASDPLYSRLTWPEHPEHKTSTG